VKPLFATYLGGIGLGLLAFFVIGALAR